MGNIVLAYYFDLEPKYYGFVGIQ